MLDQMMKTKPFYLIMITFGFILKSDAQVHTSYLWHLQQPNYWPEISSWNSFEYQKVREQDWQKFNGGNF